MRTHFSIGTEIGASSYTEKDANPTDRHIPDERHGYERSLAL